MVIVAGVGVRVMVIAVVVVIAVVGGVRVTVGGGGGVLFAVVITEIIEIWIGSSCHNSSSNGDSNRNSMDRYQ